MRWRLRACAIAIAALLAAGCERGIEPPGPPPAFLITTLAAPPGREVQRTFGFYCRWFAHTGGTDYTKAFTAANVALKGEGEKSGANAFINLTVTAVPPTDAKASGSLVMLCGDFAELR